MDYNWKWTQVAEDKPEGRVILGNDELQLVAEGEWLSDRQEWSVPWPPTHWQAMPTPPQPYKEPTFIISDGRGGKLTNNRELAERSGKARVSP